MEPRPKLKIKLTLKDKLIEILGWLALAFLWGFTLWHYEGLTEIIPLHFNHLGEVDGYGSKATILILPLIATLMFVFLTYLNKSPHIFNYPTKITPENVKMQYKNAIQMVRFLKLSIALVFSAIVFEIIQIVKGNGEVMGVWSLPIILSIILIPIGFFIIKSFKIK